MLDIKELLTSLACIINYLEFDGQQLEEDNPVLEEVSQTLVVLRRYQDELEHAQLHP